MVLGPVVETSNSEAKPMNRCRYEVVVEGELGRRYAATFDPMHLEVRDGQTAIVGDVRDQAELWGLLDSVAALGLSLISVTPKG